MDAQEDAISEVRKRAKQELLALITAWVGTAALFYNLITMHTAGFSMVAHIIRFTAFAFGLYIVWFTYFIAKNKRDTEAFVILYCFVTMALVGVWATHLI